jgi:hypothetical protein
MPIDYSKISTGDLMALKEGRYDKVSTSTLEYLKSGGAGDIAPPAPAKLSTTPGPGDAPEWGMKNPNLYGMYGAGKELLRTGIEAGATTAGAAGGALIPLPGTSLVGAGVGYAAGKRTANALFGEPVDTSFSGIGTDVAIGGLMQGAGKVIGMIPGVKKILSPAVADIGTEKPATGILDKTAHTIMEKSMKVPPSVKAGVRGKVIDTALKENVTITKGSLGRVKGLLDDLTDQMDSAVAANPNAPITTDSVLGPVKDLQAWAGKTVNGNSLSGKIQEVIDNFKAQYGDVITVAQAQEIKQNTNAFLRKSYGELKPVTEEAQKQIVRGLKDRIVQEIPEIAGINARYSDLRVLDSALERAVNRTGNWDWFSLSAGMAGTIVGGATGNVMKASEAVGLWRLLKSPVVQSNLALVLHRGGAGAKANLMANTIADTIYNKATGSNGEAQ